jgi:hypothetical protein
MTACALEVVTDIWDKLAALFSNKAIHAGVQRNLNKVMRGYIRMDRNGEGWEWINLITTFFYVLGLFKDHIASAEVIYVNQIRLPDVSYSAIGEDSSLLGYDTVPIGNGYRHQR